MLVKWVGGTPEVFIPVIDVTAQRDVCVRVPDDIGELLLRQTRRWVQAESTELEF